MFKTRFWLFVGTLILAAVPIAAQDAPKAEVLADFSLLRFNPTITGVDSHTTYGGGGGMAYFFGKYIGIVGEFQGYGGKTYTAKLAAGQVPGLPAGTYTSQGNNFTYLFGPQVKFRNSSKVIPFGEILFGGSQTSVYSGFKCTSCTGGNVTLNVPTQHPFTMAFGGGVDVNVSKNVALRLGQFDWILTRYTNPYTSTNNQNNFRFQAGIIFMLGGK
jgi:hypothetical protein